MQFKDPVKKQQILVKDIKAVFFPLVSGNRERVASSNSDKYLGAALLFIVFSKFNLIFAIGAIQRCSH